MDSWYNFFDLLPYRSYFWCNLLLDKLKSYEQIKFFKITSIYNLMHDGLKCGILW